MDWVGVIGIILVGRSLGLETTDALVIGFGSIGLWNLNASRIETLRLARAFTRAVAAADPPSRRNPHDN
jgi:UPF0716 family protein affecting phage T7 exclusion